LRRVSHGRRSKVQRLFHRRQDPTGCQRPCVAWCEARRRCTADVLVGNDAEDALYDRTALASMSAKATA
jgi:hypothetical protein